MEELKKCPECGNKFFIEDENKGEIRCGACGLVIESGMIDSNREYKNPESMGRPRRVSGNFPKKVLDKNKWIASSFERNLMDANREMVKIVSALNLSDLIRRESMRLYTYGLQKGLIRGRSMAEVVVACVYTACRTYNVPRTLDEIAGISGIKRKDIGKTYRILMRKLLLKVNRSDPKMYISRFANILYLSQKTQNDALKILQKAEVSNLMSGRGPAGIAAAALYVAALLNNEKRTQRAVADVAGITEVTIRNRYKELLEKFDLGEKAKIRTIEKKSG